MRKGYVTIFFSIAISLCLSFLVGLVYGARESAIRMKAREAIDISLRSGFGEYQKELWEHYNLIFVDASYGCPVNTMILSEEHMRTFLNKNFDENGLKILGGKDLLKLEAIDVCTDKVRFATDDKGAAIINQAVSCMKQRVGLNYIESVYNNISSGEEYILSEEQLEEISNSAEETQNLDITLINENADKIKKLVIGKKKVSMLSTLRLVMTNISEVSSVKINKASLLEKRKLNKGNFEKTSTGIADNLFFTEYLITYFGNFLGTKEYSTLKYETEYLIAGHMSDAENLEAVVNRILLVREAANMASLRSDKRKMSAIRVVAEVASAILANPELEPAIETTVVATLSFIESVDDVKMLLKGKKVPLKKKSSEWKTSVLGVLNPFDNEKDFKNGLSYQDYLRLFLTLTGEETLSKRTLNLLELNVRSITENDSFRLDLCYDAWGMTALIASKYGYSYTATREYDVEKR